jgi:uncharacterized protein YjbI with pentapeptide repeats
MIEATVTREALLEPSDGPRTLTDCTLDEGDFSGLDLGDTTFERCTKRRARFDGANLTGARFLRCRGPEASFIQADLSDAVMTGCDFSNGLLRRARLTSARFEGTKLTGADPTDAGVMGATFAEVLFAFATLPGLSRRMALVVGFYFSVGALLMSDFRGARFEDCSLRNATLEGCRFEQADLRGADLGGIELRDAPQFRGAVMSRLPAAELLSQLGLEVR